jgi:hypothetical protein
MRTLGLLAIALLPQPLVSQASADAWGATALLYKQGFKVERLAASRPPFYAFIARGHDDSLPSVVVARTGHNPAVIGKPLALWQFLPSKVHWVQLPDSVLLLQLAFDNAIEGMVGTWLYRIHDDSVDMFFTDGPDACAPASLKDLNGDGVPKLIVHSEDPSHGDCGEQCLETITETFHVTPGWVQVRQWRAEHFMPAEAEFPEFYRDLARRYDAVDRWLKSDAADGTECREVYWLENADLFAVLAQRARELAVKKGGVR